MRDQNGQVAVFFALAAVPLLAIASAAIDYASLTKERAKVSSALDAAVLAAANNNAIAVNEKDDYAKTHFESNYKGDVTFTLTPSVTSTQVRLEASGELTLNFGKLVGIKNPKLNEASAATLSSENTICVLALSEDEDGSISFDRDMEFLASGCAVHSNSKSATAIYAENNISPPTASSFCAVGGITGQVEPHSKGECGIVTDPYASVPPAPLSECKTEISYSTLIPQPGSNGNETKSDGLGAVSNVASTSTNAVNLPIINPLSTKEIQDHLEEKFGKHTFHGEDCSENDDGNDDEFGGIERREGNTKKPIEKVSKLGGNDMRKLLQAYEAYGGQLDCDENYKSECSGFNNPFSEDEYEDVPSQWVVAEIFELSYGAYLTEPETVPEIVADGTVELINGQLYSRNNEDNELVSVSENLTGGDVYLTPGTYCGGLTVDGLRVQFSPGDYIFKDGPLTFLNHSQATADRVTFGFQGAGATLNIESGSNLSIRAATHGARQGLAFMQITDQDGPGNRLPIEGVNRIASGGSVSLSGTAYFPEQTLMISGEDTYLGTNSPAVGLIANTIKFRGDRGSRVAIAVDHKKAGIPPIQPRVDDGVRLIE